MRERFVTTFILLGIVVSAFVTATSVFWISWNILMPMLFQWPELSWWVAGTFVLLLLITGSLLRGGR